MAIGPSFALLMLVIGQFEAPAAHTPPEADVVVIRQKLDQLNHRLASLKESHQNLSQIADVAICSKAAEWILRHGEFFEPAYSQWTIETLDLGLRRAGELSQGSTRLFPREGSAVLAYDSRVDGSVQPYAVTLPRDYDPSSDRKWPLHVELHGRNAKLNEVSFIHQYEGKRLKDDVAWVQLDIYGRTNNAYRWAGETDVFEALTDLKRRVKIDDSRITLRGFSMGGAGTWHLGLHHPSLWSSIGAGAGFVDTVHHLKLEAPLSPLHQKLTKIYDAQDYALNAFDVPTIGYGGELDPQLFAAKTMHAKGQELGVPIELIIGPQTAHKFHPDSLKQFLNFLAVHSRRGRPAFPKPGSIKFVTYTLKYNTCDWMTIDEQIVPYEKTLVQAEVDFVKRTLFVRTENVEKLTIQRGVAELVAIDGGEPLSLVATTSDRPVNVCFEREKAVWKVSVDRTASHAFDQTRLRKQHNLQGPIDDAFMQPFVCVRPTGTAWSAEQNAWALGNLERFEQEFDRRLRGRIPVVDDTQVSDEHLATKHLILFGDPGSNSMLAKVVDQLPIKWTRDQFELFGNSYRSAEHGFAMIFPNPLNPKRYVVVNSGHTFHEREFANSNANLYPRLGDFGVIHFARQPDGRFHESTLFSDLFDSRWHFEASSPK